MNRELSEALQTLPMASIRSTTIEGTSCNFARDELEALVSKSRPDDSEHIFVPEEGPLYILRYADPNARDDTYYEILMYPAFRERPTMIEIRQKQFIRPVL